MKKHNESEFTNSVYSSIKFHFCSSCILFCFLTFISVFNVSAQWDIVDWGLHLGDNDANSDWTREEYIEEIEYEDGYIYVVGRTKSTAGSNYVLVNCDATDYTTNFSTGFSDADAYVAKFDECGDQIWIKYFGTTGTNSTDDDYSYCLAVGQDGESTYVYVGGDSENNSLNADMGNCVCDPYKDQSTGRDAYILRYEDEGSTASLVNWTFWGGTECTATVFPFTDQILGIDTDNEGNVYICGYTTSTFATLFPTVGTTLFYDDVDNYDCANPTAGSELGDGYIAKFDPCLEDLLFFSFYDVDLTNESGAGTYNALYDPIKQDRCHSIVVKPDGTSFYVSGTTPSDSGISTINFKNIGLDAFIGKWDSDVTYGYAPDWSQYLGGNGTDRGRGLAINPNGSKVYFTGWTQSSTFPTTTGAYHEDYEGNIDAYLTKYNYTGSVDWSLILGGDQDEMGQDVVWDDFNNRIIMSGVTNSSETGFDPDVTSVFMSQINNTGSTTTKDAFISAFNSGGTSLSFFTYLGGSADEPLGPLAMSYAAHVDVGPTGELFTTFNTSSTDVGTASNVSDLLVAYHGSSNQEAFIAKLADDNDASYCGDQRTGELNNTEESGLIYPNPSANVVFVKVPFTGTDEMEVLIINNLGQTVSEFSMEGQQNTFQLDITVLPSGIYTIIVKSETVMTSSQFVKN